MDKGFAVKGVKQTLRDAQGNAIPVYDTRVMEGDGEIAACLRERVCVADIDKPLISFGKLLKNAWSVQHEDGNAWLTHETGAKAHLHFVGNSLAVNAYVRSITSDAAIRGIAIDIDEGMRLANEGWIDFQDDAWRCRFFTDRYVDGSAHIQDGFPYRSTLMRTKDNWEIIEWCEDMRKMDDREEVISQNMEDVIFILSSRMMAPGDMRLRELEEPVLWKRTKKSEPGDKTMEKEMAVEEAVELELDQVPDIINKAIGPGDWDFHLDKRCNVEHFQWHSPGNR